MLPHHSTHRISVNFSDGKCYRQAVDRDLVSQHSAASASAQPLGIEIAFVTPDVAAAHATALAAGASEISTPEAKPWGQIVSYVRSPDGTLVELCTPVASA